MPLFDSVQPPNFQLLRGDASWRSTWTHIVPGKFSLSSYSGLLFYDPSNGFAAFYETDGQGGINLLKEHNGWRSFWSLVVPGIFGNSGFSGLLLYDQQAGFGAFYDTDGDGNIIKLSEDGSWRTTWTHIIAGNFTDSKTSGLLFYDQSAGFGAIYSTNGHGGITLLAEYDDWRTTWTHILPGQFSHEGALNDPNLTDLFFYEGSNRYGEVYASTGNGGIQFMASQNQLPQATTIISGNFGGSGWTNLLFYDKRQNNDVMRSPENFNTLATVSLFDQKTTFEETGTMGIFKKGRGTVFTASTMNWALGLSQDCTWNPIDLITRNVLIMLSA